MNLNEYLTDVKTELYNLKTQAEKALEQVSNEDFFKLIDPEANSIAQLVKHISGNMRSRWRDFLTTDGEKPDRHRDTEFVISNNDTRNALMKRWNESWEILRNTLESLAPDDLDKTIIIRTKEGKVFSAIHRQMTHYSAHVGQILMLAKHFAGQNWQTLSIAKGKSDEFFYSVKKDSAVKFKPGL
ncbi:MAG: DUF1572 domain-containing protein [Calditrichaeota bacterium]|nr:MAG: DUF1572 domain-containing protein [Calditrichota bacterium]